MEISRQRLAIFEALKIAAPGAFNDEIRRSFLIDGANLKLAELEMDSLAQMEFCIAIELSTGITLLPSQLAELASTDAIERCIRVEVGGGDRALRISAGLPVNGARLRRRTSSMAIRLDRAYRLYRRRISRCRTENQLNRMHIALENYMTPAEVRYFAGALAGDAADSPSRRWIARLGGSMPINKVRPIEFERRGIFKGVTRYTADGGSASQKTLIIGFAGQFHRLMSPMPWLLDCLNPALYDVIVLRDFSRLAFAKGIPGLGGDFFEALSNLRRHVDPRTYRNVMSLGTSGGGIPAVLAAILLKLNRGLSISPQDFHRVAAKLKAHGLSDGPYAALLASRPRPFPELVLVCGADHRKDAADASALHKLVPSHLWKVKNCAQHGVLTWHLARGTLPTFLAKILGQSLENHEPVATALVATWAVDPDAGARQRSSDSEPDNGSILNSHLKS